jgi:positive regulator of sigma E activity
MLLLVFDAVSLIEELNIRHMKPRQTLMSSLISYILPTLYFMITVIATYFGLNIYIAYIIGIVLFALCGFVLFIYLKKNIASKFMDLEMVN